MVDLITPKRLFLSVPHGAYGLEELLLLLLKRFIFLSRRKINPTKSLLRTDTGRFFSSVYFHLVAATNYFSLKQTPL